jgi:hypothetical protein
VDIGFAIGSTVRLQMQRVRMANGWALGKVGGEFAQGTQTYVGQLQSGLFPRAYFAYTASHVRLWHKYEVPECPLSRRYWGDSGRDADIV